MISITCKKRCYLHFSSQLLLRPLPYEEACAYEEALCCSDYMCHDVLTPCLWIPLYRPISYSFHLFIPYTGHSSKPLSSEDKENKSIYDVVWHDELRAIVCLRFVCMSQSVGATLSAQGDAEMMERWKVKIELSNRGFGWMERNPESGSQMSSPRITKYYR